MRPRPPLLPPEVEVPVAALTAGIEEALAGAVAGIYLFGSLVAGDFQAGVSDVDLLVATRNDLDDAELERLDAMHAAFAATHPDWADRVDVAYLSLDGLRGCLEGGSPIATLSPGEGPLRRTRTLPGWATNWHQVREQGVALRGPPPEHVIPALTDEERLSAVRVHLREMPGRTAAARSPDFLVYAVFTACRGLHAAAGEGASTKTGAARWARERHPEWRELIELALAARGGTDGGAGAARLEARRDRVVDFVRVAARALEAA
jgi:hypothetical protein